ncbi:FkbM family methyltransferase [Spirosoma panaciterrae]|uniref:FkbM family methyltransferase n=1 Tax=Spirosoma panaciterrae TaxID=496058 RepID=UPI0012FBB6AB|nr:FkbM family methyltransferase [Spirosoma panaciterrae]
MFKPFWDRVVVFFKVPFIYQNYWDAYADYFRLVKNKQVVYTLRSGEKFLARAGKFDIAMLTEVLGFNVYEKAEDDIIIRPDDVVYDVGAFIGDFAIYASSRAKKVYSFEPSQSNFSLLEKNIELNRRRNVIAVDKGVNGTAVTIDLLVPDLAEHSNTIDPSLLEGRNMSYQTQTIDCLGINDILDDPMFIFPTFVKLDCEGAEFSIIDEMSVDDLKKIRCLIIEYHLTAQTPDEMAKYKRMVDKLSDIYSISSTPVVKSATQDIGLLYCRNKFVD